MVRSVAGDHHPAGSLTLPALIFESIDPAVTGAQAALFEDLVRLFNPVF